MRVLEQIENLIRDVEPSMAYVPIYVLNETDWNLDDRGLNIHGYTALSLDLSVSAQLSARGMWRGRGCAMVLYVDRIGHELRRIAGTAMHELAHWLTLPDCTSQPVSDLPAASIAASTVMANATQYCEDTRQSRPPWDHHEPDFVRACCHLAHRIARRIDGAKPWDLNFSMNYYLVDETVWMRVLEPELRSMEPESIRDILNTEPPQEFSDLARLLTAWWKPSIGQAPHPQGSE